MKKIAAGALAALTLVSGVAATATPASAQPWRGGYYHGGLGYHGGWGYGGGWGYRGWGYRGWGPGAAVGAGLLGFAVGASLAAPHYGYAAPYAYGCRPVVRWTPYGYRRVAACY